MNTHVHIALAADNGYAKHMGIVALSLLANAEKPEVLHFHFLDAGIEPQNREKLRMLIEQHGACYDFIQPDSRQYSDINTKRYGVAALFRLSIGNLLPSTINRVIYLDCDILAFDDITALCNMELGQNIIGAVTNLGHQPSERLNIPDGEYFNSGVLLVDLQRWRNQCIGDQVLSYLTQHNKELVFPDQDSLNHVLKGCWQHLPLRWNLQPATYSMYGKGVAQHSLTRDSYHEAIQNPGLVHFLGNSKPWDFMTFHPLKNNYWAYIARSPWNTFQPEKNSLINKLKRALQIDKAIRCMRRRHSIPADVRKKGF